MSKFLHEDNNNNNAKAIAIPRLFSENSQAKNDKETKHNMVAFSTSCLSIS